MNKRKKLTSNFLPETTHVFKNLRTPSTQNHVHNLNKKKYFVIIDNEIAVKIVFIRFIKKNKSAYKNVHLCFKQLIQM